MHGLHATVVLSLTYVMYGGIAHNFDSIVTKIFIYRANGPRIGDFQYVHIGSIASII